MQQKSASFPTDQRGEGWRAADGNQVAVEENNLIFENEMKPSEVYRIIPPMTHCDVETLRVEWRRATPTSLKPFCWRTFNAGIRRNLKASL